MSTFAHVIGGVVAEVIVAPSAAWCTQTLGGLWVETFTDGTRGKFAGPGDLYDPVLDAFVSPSAATPDDYVPPEVP